MTMLPGASSMRRFPYSVGQYQSITPFTERDGYTYLELLERIRTWIQDDFAAHVDAEVAKLVESVNAAMLQLHTAIDDAEAARDGALAAEARIGDIENTVKEYRDTVIAKAAEVQAALEAAVAAVAASEAASEEAKAALAEAKVVIAAAITTITNTVMANLRIDLPLGIPRLDDRAKLAKRHVDHETLSEPLAHDVFSRHPATGQPVAMASGQAYGSYVMGGDPSKWVVAGNMLDVADGYPAGYLETNLEQKVGRIGAEFSFDSRGGTLTSQGMFAMISWADGGYAASGVGRRTGMHIIVFSSGVLEVTFRSVVAGDFTSLAQWRVGGFRTDPSFVNRIDAMRSGNTVTIVLNGKAYSLTDDRVRAVAGENFACWEPYYPGNVTTAIRARIRRVWADGETQVEGSEASNSRQAAAHAQTTVLGHAGNAYVLGTSADYVRIPATSFTVVAGATGQAAVTIRCWARVGSGLFRARIIRTDGAGSVTIHLADPPSPATNVESSLSGAGIFTGMRPFQSIQVELEMAGEGGAVTFGDAFSGRQIVLTSTPC